jgi:hypothetical protein
MFVCAHTYLRSEQTILLQELINGGKRPFDALVLALAQSCPAHLLFRLCDADADSAWVATSARICVSLK